MISIGGPSPSNLLGFNGDVLEDDSSALLHQIVYVQKN